MDFPLIKRNKNEFSLIKKNFIHINRYKSIINNFNLIPTSFATIESKLNIINSHNTNDSQKHSEFNSKKRSNNIFKKYISIYNNNKFNSNIFNKKKFDYFSSLSPSKSHSRFNFTTFSKNINTSYNTIVHVSSNMNDNSPEKRFLRSNKSNPNLIIQRKKEIKKIDKILTKFKLNKIISDNSKNCCFIQEMKNNYFLESYKNKLLSDQFINCEINRHRNFLFSKNENPIKKMNNYLIITDYSKNLKKSFSSEDIIRSLNKKDIKLIKADVSYFKGINKNILKDLMNINSNTICLMDILNKEEAKEDENKNVKKQKKVIKDIRKNENILYNYDKYINKVINKDLNQRLKKIKIKNDKKKIENVLDNYSFKININKGKLSSEKNIKCEDRCFQTFMIHLDDELTKKYYIERNRKRILKEKSFQHQKDLKLKKEENEKEFILGCLQKFKKGLKK